MADDSGQAGAFEIEITPEMIEAGASVLIFDRELIREEVAFDVIKAALDVHQAQRNL